MYDIFLTTFYVFYLSGINDGANIEQWAIGYGWRQNQEAKLKNVGGAIYWSNQQLYNICNCVITFTIKARKWYWKPLRGSGP